MLPNGLGTIAGENGLSQETDPPLASGPRTKVSNAVTFDTSPEPETATLPLPVLSDDALRDALRGPTEEETAARVKVTRTLERYLRRVEASQFVPKLRQLRNEAIEFAREQRLRGYWDIEIDGPLLQEVIRTAQARERVYAKSSSTGRVLEPPELTKMLRDDPWQHTCDVKVCSKMLVGWTCVFVFCHVPWIIALVVIGVNYQAPLMYNVSSSSNDDNLEPLGPTQEQIDLQNACTAVGRYLFGFFIIYCTNIIVGLAVAVARNVDDSKNLCVRVSPYVTAFISISILGYNLYGIIVVWNSNLWSSSQSASCVSIRGLAVAVLSFFLLLPVLCFGLLQLLGSRISESAEPVDAASSVVTSTLNQQQQQQDNVEQGNETGDKAKAGQSVTAKGKPEGDGARGTVAKAST